MSAPNPFAVQGNNTVSNAAEHGQAPAQGVVGAPFTAPPVPGGLPTGIPGGAQEMAFNVNYDDVKSNRFKVGPCALVCTDVQPSTSAAGNPMHVFSFRGINPQDQEKEARIYCALTPNALWKHQETLTALGFAASGTVSFTRGDVVGRCAIGEFIEEDDRQNAGQKRVNLNKLVPHPAGAGITLQRLQQAQGQGLPQIGNAPMQAQAGPVVR